MKKALSLGAVFIFIFLILYNPEIAINSAVKGLVLCGRVIIPSLYPFTFCVLFIIKCTPLKTPKFIDKITTKIFGFKGNLFFIFLLSLIGGYPLGARLLSNSKDKTNAPLMLNYCVNAGPAFIILSVGVGVFHSREIGFLLFLSHIIPSLVLAILFKGKIKITPEKEVKKPSGLIDDFVLSASEAAATLINICAFVILFSVICDYISLCPVLKPLTLILEVSNALTKVHNVYLLSALLGLGGICVWCQTFSLAKGFKINYFAFILCRIFHAVSSGFLSYIFLKIFNITVPVLSNNSSFASDAFFKSGSVGISLIITGIILIISLSSKNFAGNILEDVV
jgi:hypothetical protein